MHQCPVNYRDYEREDGGNRVEHPVEVVYPPRLGLSLHLNWKEGSRLISKGSIAFVFAIFTAKVVAVDH